MRNFETLAGSIAWVLFASLMAFAALTPVELYAALPAAPGLPVSIVG